MVVLRDNNRLKSHKSVPRLFLEVGQELPYTSLLDPLGIIQNFEKDLIKKFEVQYGDLEITRITQVDDVNKELHRKLPYLSIINDLTPPKDVSQDLYSNYENLVIPNEIFLKEVMKRFKSQMYWSYTHRKVLTARNRLTNNLVSWEALNRFQSNKNVYKISRELEALESVNPKVVMLTLTYDRDTRTLIEALESVSKDWNRFITRLKIEISKSHMIPVNEVKLPFLRVIEAQPKTGYPHIHALFFGVDWLYYNGSYNEYVLMKNGDKVPKSLESFWKLGFTSVNRTKGKTTVSKPVNYLMSYVRKTWNNWTPDSILTKSLLWAFNKRTFDTSRDLSTWIRLQTGFKLEKPTIGSTVNKAFHKLTNLDDVSESEDLHYYTQIVNNYNRRVSSEVPEELFQVRDEFWSTLYKIDSEDDWNNLESTLYTHLRHYEELSSEFKESFKFDGESLFKIEHLVTGFIPDDDNPSKRFTKLPKDTATRSVEIGQRPNSGKFSEDLETYTIEDVERLSYYLKQYTEDYSIDTLFENPEDPNYKDLRIWNKYRVALEHLLKMTKHIPGYVYVFDVEHIKNSIMKKTEKTLNKDIYRNLNKDGVSTMELPSRLQLRMIREHYNGVRKD